MNNIDGIVWCRVSPPVLWERAGMYVVADSFLADGTRVHMVRETVPPNTIIDNAIVMGEMDVLNPMFSPTPSHLSNKLENK